MTTAESTVKPSSLSAIAASRIDPRVRLWRAVMPYLLILPTFLLILTFTLWPAVGAVIRSTYKPGPTVRIADKFVGLDNYIGLFSPNNDMGQVFPRILVQTLIFVGVTVPVSMIVAFALALLLNRKMRLTGLYRFAFFYPVLMPMIGAASVFAFIFANNVGLANTVLHSLGLPTVNWIGDETWTPISIMMIAIWKQVGFFMIIYLAGLQNLPQDVYEAADLDGANWWDKIRRITVPLLSGTVMRRILSHQFAPSRSAAS